jgi:hypothetical protein
MRETKLGEAVLCGYGHTAVSVQRTMQMVGTMIGQKFVGTCFLMKILDVQKTMQMVETMIGQTVVLAA